MRKKINLEKISDITIKITDKLKLLEEAKKEIVIDINKLDECYTGKDAEIIKNKYIKSVNNINNLTDTLEAYILYFKYITGNYRENKFNATKHIDEIMNSVMNTFSNDETHTEIIFANNEKR